MAQYSDYAMPYGWGEFDEPEEKPRNKNPRPENPFLKLKVGEEKTYYFSSHKDCSRAYGRAKSARDKHGIDLTYSSRNGIFTIRRNS